MYNRLLFFAAACLLCSSLWSQTNSNPHSLIPYRSGDLWGYVRPGGTVAIPAKFTEAGLFSRYLPPHQADRDYNFPNPRVGFPLMDQPYAQVRVGELYGLMDTAGRFLVPPISTWPLSFSPVDTQLIWVVVLPEQAAKEAPEYEDPVLTQGLLHCSGRMVLPLEYQAYSYENERDCAIHLEDDLYGNRSIQSDEYDCTPWSFYSEYLSIRKNDKLGVIWKDGTAAFPPVWDYVTRPRDGRMLAGYLDTTDANYRARWVLVGPGNQVLKTFSLDFWPVVSRYGPTPVRERDTMGYLNSSGDWAIAEKFSQALPFSKNGFAIVRELPGAWKIIDTTGKKIMDLLGPDGCQPWREGYYIQLADSLYYRHDRHFKKTGTQGLDGAPAEFVWKGKTFLSACRQGKWGVMDEQEQIELPFQYPYVINLNSRFGFANDVTYFQVHSGSLRGLLDSNFKEIIPCQYSQFSPAGDGYGIIVRTDADKFGLYSLDGRQLLPAVYDGIRPSENKQQGWYSVQKGELYGSFHRDGTPQIPFVYRRPLTDYSFKARFTAVPALDGWHVFDSTGQLLVRVPSDAEECWNVEKTSCDTCFELMVRKGEHRFYIDQNGKSPLPYAEYELFFRKGSLLLAVKNGLQGLFRLPDLQQLVPCEFQYIQEVDGRLFVKKPEWPALRLWDTATQTARELDVQFTRIIPVGEGLLRIDRDCNWYGFLDTNLQLAIPLIYTEAHAFFKGLAAVRDSSGRWGFIDRQGAWQIGPKFQKVYSFEADWTWVQYPADISGAVRTAFIDPQEKVLFEWDNARTVIADGVGPYSIMENLSEPKTYSLLDRRNWTWVVNDCDCIQGKNDKAICIKNNQIQVFGGALEAGDLREVLYADVGVKFVVACGLTSMQDLQSNTLIPFGQWNHYSVHPESSTVITHFYDQNGLSISRIYDLSGRFLQEITGAQPYRPMNGQLICVGRDGKTELLNYKTGRLLCPPGIYQFLLLEGMQLVRVMDEAGQLVGYCDYDMGCYFGD